MINEPAVIVFGIPFDQKSSFLRGAAQAPKLIQSSLYSDSSNLFSECGLDLSLQSLLYFDDELHVKEDHVLEILKCISKHIQNNQNVVSLGGDHSITYPLIKAHAESYRDLTVVHFDAHPDLYDDFEGDKLSHASPFARIMEEGLIKRLVQVGIRTLTTHQREQIERFGVEVIEMKDFRSTIDLNISGSVYVSIDLDVLDPAFAPGISHHEPGGMTTRELITVIQGLGGRVVGADLVEYNPSRDINGMTGMVAAKLLKELVAKIVNSSGFSLK